MALTDAQARAARPRDGRLTKLSDGRGLQLWAHPSGKRSWHLAFRAGGRQRSITLGDYPALSLKAARQAADEARARIAAGALDAPIAAAPAPTFGALKAQWLDGVERSGTAPATIEKAIWLAGLSRELDARPIAELRAPDILAVLKRLEAAGQLETASRLRSTISKIFRYAAAGGHVDTDPTALLRGALLAPRPTHRPALVKREDFARLMRAIAAYQGKGGIVRDGLFLLALTAARPGELRLALWPEFDLEAAVWTVPPSRMKMRLPHRAPLSRAAVEILARLKAEDGQARPPSPFILPSPRPGRPLSENAFNVALRAMGFAGDEATAHGFRSSFSTLANESGLWNFDAVERALAHVDANDVRRAYHRADYFDERRRLMEWWAGEIMGMIGD
ncbi:tyrosine-type recombinase/integrase [Methylocystis parvus]|uniref:tyrosine-type recombinase/integrase n=1 Tax=Methylocystis parvus TaxID=134 RepID=UPI003C7678BA